MYEEDRETTLNMYERMFDECADEQALTQLLVSPTRQAVVLARSYDAKERKLQIESRSMDENYMPDPEDVPSFVFVIDRTAQQAAELGVKAPAVTEGQVSFFDEPVCGVPEEQAPEASESAEEAVPVPAEAEEVSEEAAAEPVEPSLPAGAEEETAEEETEQRSSVDETADAVDAFLADFTIENGELVPSKAAEEAEPEAAVEELSEDEAEDVPEAEETAAARTRTKTNILLLVLYIFIALPIGIVGVALLLAIAALFLALAVSCASVGVSVIGMCFGSFAVIADIMVVFGAALAALALALLFVWLFIWFLGGAVAGFIRGLCRLGRKICCKEVEAQ